MNHDHHMERSRVLAESVGYSSKDVKASTKDGKVFVRHRGKWREFDYRHPDVIRPIAERYNLKPTQVEADYWRVEIAPMDHLYGDSEAHVIMEAVFEMFWDRKFRSKE